VGVVMEVVCGGMVVMEVVVEVVMGMWQRLW
jgi:hypothetical protein